MSGNKTSRAKLARSSSRPGVIQLCPLAHPATVGGEKKLLAQSAGRDIEIRNAGNAGEAELAVGATASSTGLLICVPTDAGL